MAVPRAIRGWRALGPRLGRYAPRSTLELPAHLPTGACVPALDFHTHLGRWLRGGNGWMEPDVGRVLALMDECNVTGLVNLDGRWGRELEENLDRYDRAHPGRFFTFCHLDWDLLDRRGGPDLLVRSLERSVAAGARGVKVWKDLGMRVTMWGRTTDRRTLPDDPALAPLWQAAGALHVPVLVHVADPVAFFQPVDRHNERLEELLRAGKRPHQPRGLDELRRLFDAFENLVCSNPSTVFVAAHGYCVENLGRVSELLDRYQNLHVDIAAVAHQLGRQPRTARSLFLRHPDRILFGSDAFPIRPAVHRVCFRILETDDEAFAYSDDPLPPNGRWPVYGLDLPASVLEQVYRANARRLLDLRAPDRDGPIATAARQPRGGAET